MSNGEKKEISISQDSFSNLLVVKRRKRDLNPRAAWTTYTLSRGASSASWVFLHNLNYVSTNIKLYVSFRDARVIIHKPSTFVNHFFHFFSPADCNSSHAPFAKPHLRCFPLLRSYLCSSSCAQYNSVCKNKIMQAWFVYLHTGCLNCCGGLDR